MLSTVITKHAKQRTKDRCGISKKISKKIADKALEKGIKHSDTTGSLKRYLDKIYLAQHNANNLRIYMEKIFLFHNNSQENIELSIFNLPQKYKKTIIDIKNKINKN
jgi:hypothetical protein